MDFAAAFIWLVSLLIAYWCGWSDRGSFVELQRVGEIQVVWGGNYFTDYLVPKGKWLIWDKGQTDFSLADCEMAWTSLDGAIRRILYPRATALKDGKVHPTQKPLGVMEWCIKQIGDIRNVLDPFAGSGTTLVAAKKMGIHFLGFEMNSDYCAIAQRRLGAVDAQPVLFSPRPEQFDLSL
jgi:hypothetical protein